MENFILNLKKALLLPIIGLLLNIVPISYINAEAWCRKKTVIIPAIVLLATVAYYNYSYSKPAVAYPQSSGIEVASTQTNKPSDQEKKFLKTIIEQIITYAKKMERQVNDFFDTKNNEKYVTHVTKFKQELATMQTTLLVPLQEKTATTHSSVTYTALINHIHQIIVDLHTSLAKLTHVLEGHKQTSARNVKNLINDLQQLQKSSEQELANIEQKVQQLYGLLLPYDIELAQKVMSLRNNLRGLLAKNGNNNLAANLEMFRGITRRLRA